MLDLQNDSNLVIYGVHGGAIWSREGGGPPLTYGQWPGTSGPGAAHLYYGYPYADPPACTDGGACVLDKWGFDQGQCTSWAAYRLNQLNGIHFTDSYGGDGTWSDAIDWGPHARALGIAVNGTPAVGSVAWYSSGHVAYVEQVELAHLDRHLRDELRPRQRFPGAHHHHKQRLANRLHPHRRPVRRMPTPRCDRRGFSVRTSLFVIALAQ